MDLRIENLAQIDPHAAPLPHGTEVTLGVDRVHDGRVVAQGTVGRIVASGEGTVDVAIVGVGTLRFERSQVVPRRVGQVRFAARREAAWEALRPCVLLETTVGSRAWGLADEHSDTDVRGVFGLPFSWTQGLAEPPADLVSADGSVTYWNVAKAVRNALRADPNTLEMFFVPSARACDPIGEWLLEARDAFVSVEIHGSFGRYALSQLKRLEQNTRLVAQRTLVLEWLRQDPGLSLDSVASRLADASVRAAPTRADAVHQAKQGLKQLYRSLCDQGLLASNEFAAMAKFAAESPRALEMPRELRPKNAYNLIRLIRTATRWLRDGHPVFEAIGDERERLLAIKRGEVSLDDVIAEAEQIAPELDAARKSSALPARPDVARADALLRRVGVEIARRFIENAPGPFGRDAPLPPEVAWNE